MAESFSREKLRQAPQKEGGWKILCYLLPVWPRLVRPFKSRMNGKKHTHTHTHTNENPKSRQFLCASLFPQPLLILVGHIMLENFGVFFLVITYRYSRVWINRVRLPILLVVSWTGKIIFPCPRACLRIWSRETGSAVPSRVSLLIPIFRLNLVLTYGIPPEFRGGVHLWNRHRHRVSPEFIGSRNCVPMAFTAESPPAQGQ